MSGAKAGIFRANARIAHHSNSYGESRIGAVLFIIPYLWAPFFVIGEHAVVVFPTGIACSFLVSLTTLPFRPRAVRYGNA
jgi:hypothetical protein